MACDGWPAGVAYGVVGCPVAGGLRRGGCPVAGGLWRVACRGGLRRGLMACDGWPAGVVGCPVADGLWCGGGDDRIWLEHSYDSFLSEQQTAPGRSKAQRQPRPPSASAQQHEPEQGSTTQTGTRSITATSISIHLPPSFPLSCSFIFVVLFKVLLSGRSSTSSLCTHPVEKIRPSLT